MTMFSARQGYAVGFSFGLFGGAALEMTIGKWILPAGLLAAVIALAWMTWTGRFLS